MMYYVCNKSSFIQQKEKEIEMKHINNVLIAVVVLIVSVGCSVALTLSETSVKTDEFDMRIAQTNSVELFLIDCSDLCSKSSVETEVVAQVYGVSVVSAAFQKNDQFTQNM